jgi:hypothetical protein
MNTDNRSRPYLPDLGNVDVAEAQVTQFNDAISPTWGKVRNVPATWPGGVSQSAVKAHEAALTVQGSQIPSLPWSKLTGVPSNVGVTESNVRALEGVLEVEWSKIRGIPLELQVGDPATLSTITGDIFEYQQVPDNNAGNPQWPSRTVPAVVVNITGVAEDGYSNALQTLKPNGDWTASFRQNGDVWLRRNSAIIFDYHVGFNGSTLNESASAAHLLTRGSVNHGAVAFVEELSTCNGWDWFISGGSAVGFAPRTLMTAPNYKGVPKLYVPGHTAFGYGDGHLGEEVGAFEPDFPVHIYNRHVNGVQAAVERNGRVMYIGAQDSVGTGHPFFGSAADTGISILPGGNLGLYMAPTGRARFFEQIEVTGAGQGVLLRAPNNAQYRLTVTNAGTLNIVAV